MSNLVIAVLGGIAGTLLIESMWSLRHANMLTTRPEKDRVMNKLRVFAVMLPVIVVLGYLSSRPLLMPKPEMSMTQMGDLVIVFMSSIVATLLGQVFWAMLKFNPRTTQAEKDAAMWKMFWAVIIGIVTFVLFFMNHLPAFE